MGKLLARIADRPTLSLVVAFVLLDLIALLCAWLFTIDVLDSRFFKQGRDRGLGELFEYGKFALVIYMLLQIFRATGEPILRAWLILFAVMLADNFIGIHEEVGEIIINNFILPDVGFKRPKDLAEIMVLAVLEGSAALYVAYSYFCSGPMGRQFSQQFCAVFGVFVFFALVLDAAGPLVIEELGEMIGMTLIMGWLHQWFWRDYSEPAASIA